MEKISLFSSLPIVAALEMATQVIKSPQGRLVWHSKGVEYPLQTQLTNNWDKMRNLLQVYRKLDQDQPAQKRLILAEIAKEAKTINDFMARNGFPGIKLTELFDPNAFYVGGIYREGGKHRSTGTKGYEVMGRYKAFRVTSDGGVRVHSYQDRLILEVPNFGGFSLLITAQEKPVEKFEQLLLWEKILNGMKPTGSVNAVLPQWKFKGMKIDVSGLEGLWTPDEDGGPNWFIAQALMQADCTLGWDGTFFKSGFAASVTRERFMMPRRPEPGDFVVEWPLCFAYARRGQLWPSATGYVPVSGFSQEDVSLQGED